MPKTRKRKRSKTNKKKSPKRQSGFNLGKFTLGMLILVSLGYGYLAIHEGRLVPEAISDFELPDLLLDDTERQEEKSEKSAPPIEVQPNTSAISSSPIDFEAFDLYFTKAFDFMWPSYMADEAIVERPYYTLRYSEEHEQPMWVAYKLVGDSLMQDKFERKDDFREDPRIRTGSASLADYKGSGYDRGHLAPAADFSYDEFALSQSFYMSNMSPQDPSFNRGIWKKLEEQVRDWANENTEIYVVTGPILNKNYNTIGTSEVSIPEYYYKIILDIDKPEIKAIAFLMKNEKTDAELSSFVVPIDQIEELTSLDFFPTLPDQLEDKLEAELFTTAWF